LTSAVVDLVEIVHAVGKAGIVIRRVAALGVGGGSGSGKCTGRSRYCGKTRILYEGSSIKSNFFSHCGNLFNLSIYMFLLIF
jgi:ABC-type microcin C transport system duplicated ATPase subunit YejF